LLDGFGEELRNDAFQGSGEFEEFLVAPPSVGILEKYNEATFSDWRVFRLADVHLTLEVVERIRACC